MFENIDSTFYQALCFLAAGAAFGLCYELLRFIRMLFRHHAVVVFIEDTLFFTVCGFVSFIIALWVGIGYFRIYYPIALVYQVHIPTYPSGHWLFGFASKKYHPVEDQNAEWWLEQGLRTKYYNRFVHGGKDNLLMCQRNRVPNNRRLQFLIRF